jgi:flagellar hook-associated protein 2
MASTISTPATRAAAIDSQIRKLATTFQTAISATIDSESAPLKKVQSQKDAIDIRRAVYTDMKTNFDGLQSAIQALISTQASYGLNLNPKTSISPAIAGSTVFSAVASDSAPSGEYDISVTDLAKANTIASADEGSADVALGKSGIIYLGGNGVTSTVTAFTPGTSLLNAVASNSVAEGQRELGSGNYSVQVRDLDGTRQFRLVNADGAAVSIRNGNDTSYTTAWQTMTDGTVDTGRGLTLTLSSVGSVGSTGLTYTAKGTSITVTAADTLRTIAKAINLASQPEGRDFKATLVANKLVLTGAQTGSNHGLLFTDSVGLGLTDELQVAQNATFNVNGMDVSRASNSGLTDVIEGLTLNLASDAKGKSAHLSVASTSDKATATINTLVSKFNAALTHLTQKMAITSSTSGTTTTYTRNALTNDTVFSTLRSDMYSRISRSYTNSGSIKSLADIGLSLDKDLKLTFDSTKFSTALQNHSADVTALLDTAMGQFSTVLTGYTGVNGALQRSINSMDDQKKTYDSRIDKYTDSLTMRKQSLFNTYLDMQTQLVEMNYQSNMLNILLYGTSTTSSLTGTTTNTTG